MTELPRRRLGSTDLELSPVGIGTAPIGSRRDWRIYWGHQDEGEAIRAIQAAIDEGINWIDTAPFYGWGHAADIVGRAIRDRRDRVLVFTKCGTIRDPTGDDFMDLSPDATRRDMEGSLRRLGLDHLDLLQPHDSDARVLPFCHEHGIEVLSWGSLAEGLLTEGFDLERLEPHDFRRTRQNFQVPRYSRIRTLVAELAGLTASYGRRASDLALRWLLSRPGMTGAIVGTRSVDEAQALAQAGSWELPEEPVGGVEEALDRFDEP